MKSKQADILFLQNLRNRIENVSRKFRPDAELNIPIYRTYVANFGDLRENLKKIKKMFNTPEHYHAIREAWLDITDMGQKLEKFVMGQPKDIHVRMKDRIPKFLELVNDLQQAVGAALTDKLAKQQEPERSDVETIDQPNRLIHNADCLIEACPDTTMAPGGGITRQVQQCKSWCEQVAQWTLTVYENKKFGPTIRNRMNWFVSTLKPNGWHREKYDTLVHLLLDGYKLIGEKAPPGARLSGQVLHGKDKIKLMPASDFAETARRMIEKEFGNPFTPERFKEFNLDTQPITNPIVEQILSCFEQARRWLVCHLRAVHITYQACARFQASEFTSANKATEWTKAYHSIQEAMSSVEAVQAAPWFYLAVNMIGFYTPRKYDVLRELDPKAQEIIAVIITSGGIGPALPFVASVCKSLNMVRADLSTLDGNGEIATMAKKRKHGYPVFEDFLSQRVPHEVYSILEAYPKAREAFGEHIENVMSAAENFGQYLQKEYKKAAKKDFADSQKQPDGYQWIVCTDGEWRDIYFDAPDIKGFWVKEELKPNPLDYLRSMVTGSLSKLPSELLQLDYQYFLIACVYECVFEQILFCLTPRGLGAWDKELKNRICRRVWSVLTERPKSLAKVGIIQDKILEAIRAIEADLVKADEKPLKSRPKLGDTAALIYEKLLTLPEHRAMKLPEIVLWLWEKHQINLSDSAVYQKHLKQLRPWGLQHDKRIGYSITQDKKV